jgi:type VI secretion system secreted protein VgrG
MALQDELTVTLESASFACDDLKVRKIVGTEAIGRLFDFEVQVVCPDHDGPSPDSMLGAGVTLVLERQGDAGAGWHGARRVHGTVAEVDDLLSTHAGVREYALRVVPRAYLLAMVETQDIFMNLSVPDIIRSKIESVDLTSDLEMRLTGTYAKREFVVQYKESDLAFVSRLAEHAGISFYLEPGDASDKLVFTDHQAGFWRGDDERDIPFHSNAEEGGVTALAAKRRVVPAYYVVNDYNYRTPQVDLIGEHQLEGAFAGGVVEFGAHHKTPVEAQALASIRAEERLAAQRVYTGKSRVPGLSAGTRVTIADHPDLGSVQLLVTEVEHRATQIAGADGERTGYENTFRAIPAERTYRPPRVTPRPRIAGLITGVIDGGPAGARPRYAQIDEQGRYWVRFHFDLTTPGERPASRPVRMLQNHAGAGYGTHFPLKPGVEVLIGFVDGDPDRPLIVGAVPNPVTPSPVNGVNPGVHRVQTSTGICVDLAE